LIQAEVRPAKTPAEAGAMGGRGHKAADNVRSFGNNPTYALRRLKRDRPDLAERVVAGELSANAAAIEAGFRKKSTPFHQAERAIRKCSCEDLDRLARLIVELKAARACR
jgi:hypothetical protein